MADDDDYLSRENARKAREERRYQEEASQTLRERQQKQQTGGSPTPTGCLVLTILWAGATACGVAVVREIL